MHTIYITTPIYYINDAPHVGHAYTTIAADVLARYGRMRGFDVVFATGTDEHSQKNLEAAKGEDLSAYLDRMAARWQLTWNTLGITFTDFIRTTEQRHEHAVVALYEQLKANGDVAMGTYEGYYCPRCEEFITPSDLRDGRCPTHAIEPDVIKEENIFFTVSKYRERILEYIAQHPDLIEPVSRRNELMNFVRDHLGDMSISRQSGSTGIAVPDAPGHVFYVWFDALVSYLTVAGFASDKERFARVWPPSVQLIGKDILKFHGGLWLAMLMAAGLELPKKIFVHGYFTVDGVKMSKSLGNGIAPEDVATAYGNDVLRYYLLREIPFGADGDFSFTRLHERYNGDLANGLGNTVARTLSLVSRFAKPLKMTQSEMAHRTAETWGHWEHALEAQEFHNALAAVWELLRVLDRDIEATQPWKLIKEGNLATADLLGGYTEALRHIALMLLPLMPDVAEKILSALGIADAVKSVAFDELKRWGSMGVLAPTSAAMLFPRIEESRKAFPT